MRFGFEFSLGPVDYQVRVHRNWELVVCARTRDPKAFGWDDSDNWNMPEFYYTFDTHGHCETPLRFFRQLHTTLAPWLRKAQPGFLFFRCADRKKFALYQRLLARVGLEDLYEMQLIEQHAYLTLRQPHTWH